METGREKASFFKGPSKKQLAGGPSQEALLSAFAWKKDWLVVNFTVLEKAPVDTDKKLNMRFNAFKHALQVYGPTGYNLPDCRSNSGTENTVFHGHITGSTGTTYVLEWGVNREQRAIKLLQFKEHENFSYRRERFEGAEVDSAPDFKKIKQRRGSQRENAKDKLERVGSGVTRVQQQLF